MTFAVEGDGLDDHDADAGRDDVVQLPCDAGPFLEHRRPCRGVPLALESDVEAGQRAALTAKPGDQAADRPRQTTKTGAVSSVFARPSCDVNPLPRSPSAAVASDARQGAWAPTECEATSATRTKPMGKLPWNSGACTVPTEKTTSGTVDRQAPAPPERHRQRQSEHGQRREVRTIAGTRAACADGQTGEPGQRERAREQRIADRLEADRQPGRRDAHERHGTAMPMRCASFARGICIGSHGRGTPRPAAYRIDPLG